jgi:hypothetical protein
MMPGFLIFTELPYFASYITRQWASFGLKANFGMLSLAMLLLGNSILGRLNQQATSQHVLGLNNWLFVFAIGILVMVVAVINLICVGAPSLTCLHPRLTMSCRAFYCETGWMAAQLAKHVILGRMYLLWMFLLSRHLEVSRCAAIVVCDRCGFTRLMGKRWPPFLVRWKHENRCMSYQEVTYSFHMKFMKKLIEVAKLGIRLFYDDGKLA